MNKTVISIILAIFSLTTQAQVIIRSGSQDPTLGKEFYKLSFKVLDNFTGMRIPYVNAYLMTTDSVVVDSLQDRNGNFSFKVRRDKSFRSCIIKLTHHDYQTQYSTHSLKSVGKQNYFNLPDLFMKRRNTFTDRTLDEVVVTATKVKMYYRGDTIVYNADAFNVADGSMLDALIKQMPGTELNKNGEIFVNGRKIDNLLLNGKDIFRGNNKLMLENLPYYTVKEIKVYDQMPEKAVVLHDETAEKEYVMDVNLKKEYSKGYMANVEVGAGIADGTSVTIGGDESSLPYIARLFGLRFTDVSHLAVVGGQNNLNMGDYTFSGYAYDSDARERRTTNNLLTATLLTEHKRSKNQLTVELNRKKSERGSDVFEETFHNEASTFSTSQNSTVNRNIGVSLANTFTLKMPFWMQSQTKMSFNNKKDDTDERYYESGTDTRQQGLSVLDSLFSKGAAINDPSMISARKRWINGKKKEYGASQYFNISQKLFSGDLIDFTTGVNYEKSTNETDRFNRYITWNPSQSQTDIAEDIDRPNTHVKARADLSYKISRWFYGTDMRFFVNYNFDHNKDRETIIDGVSLVPDIENSYQRRMNENKYNVGMDYNYEHLVQDRKLRTKIGLRLPLSIFDRRTKYNRYTVDTCLTQSPVFFEPSLSFTHSKWRGDNASSSLWKFSAASSLERSLPDATLLITLPLTSDKINIYQGNANLKSPTTWRSRLSWNWPMKKQSAYLEHSLDYTSYFNRIVNTYRYEAGVYTNKPDNMNGTWDLEFNTTGQQFANISKLPITINYNLWSRYQRMKNYVADGATGQPRQMDNDELRNDAQIQFRTYYKDVSGGFRLSAEWRKPLNNREDMGYRDTWDYKGEFWFTAKLPLGIDWETECGLIKRQGYSNDELNKLSCEWDMTLSKSILKNKIGLKLKAIDILHQYKSVAYVVNERGIRETRTVSLPAYWLFSMTYKFNKQPKKK